mmetsp:Transcript_4423/g.14321  ORF Transcript_4423/g.14321 Transcript_4423/m.14321 type:complete len:281 (+) Transcript_4423:549-1391(+)
MFQRLRRFVTHRHGVRPQAGDQATFGSHPLCRLGQLVRKVSLGLRRSVGTRRQVGQRLERLASLGQLRRRHLEPRLVVVVRHLLLERGHLSPVLLVRKAKVRLEPGHLGGQLFDGSRGVGMSRVQRSVRLSIVRRTLRRLPCLLLGCPPRPMFPFDGRSRLSNGSLSLLPRPPHLGPRCLLDGGHLVPHLSECQRVTRRRFVRSSGGDGHLRSKSVPLARQFRALTRMFGQRLAQRSQLFTKQRVGNGGSVRRRSTRCSSTCCNGGIRPSGGSRSHCLAA